MSSSTIAPQTPTIRRAGAADVQALALVGAATFLESFAGILAGENILEHCAKKHSVEAYRRSFEEAHTAAWLAELDGAPVGYALITAPAELNVPLQPGDLELKRIYLLSRCHGTGTGRALMQTALAYAQRQGADRLLLGVYGQNHRAIAFYRRCGFVEAGARTFHIGKGTYHDLIFARSFSIPPGTEQDSPQTT